MSFVKSIINDWDPIDLLSHAPDDEYHSEIESIQYLLCTTDDSDELSEGILNTFVKSFGQEIFNKGKEDCKKIAHILLSQKAEKDAEQGDGSVVP